MPTERFIKLNPNKKNTIEDAIIKELVRHPYEHINVSNIVRDANISRGSFYQYFSNKQDFFIYILHKLGEIKSSYIDIDVIQNNAISFLDKLKHVLLASIQFSKHYPDYVVIGLHLYASTHQDVKAYMFQAKTEMSKLMETWIDIDPLYQKLNQKTLIIDYISDSMLYFTHYYLKFNNISMLEKHLNLFIKVLEGGIHNV